MLLTAEDKKALRADIDRELAIGRTPEQVGAALAGTRNWFGIMSAEQIAAVARVTAEARERAAKEQAAEAATRERMRTDDLFLLECLKERLPGLIARLRDGR